MIDVFIYSIVLVFLIIASISDIKTREVPDWLNYSMVGLALGIRLIYSLINNNWLFLTYGVAGFALFFLIALAMFYSGQWGGGDSKTLMALGALIGLRFTINSFLVSFIINIIFVGAIYGLTFSLVLAFKNRKKFLKAFRKRMIKHIKIRKIIIALSFILLLSILFTKGLIPRLFLAMLVFTLYFGFYIWLFVKVVEEACMLRYVKPAVLTEGDWIAKDIKVNNKIIVGPKDLGISKKQMKQLVNLYKKKKIKRVLMKVGIPFVPSFLLAFIFTYIVGNILFLIS